MTKESSGVSGRAEFLFGAYYWIASRPWIAGIIVFLSAVLLAMAAGAARGFPPSTVHDAFSYLLGAETFASGRLTNPAHPMWRYFETFQILQQPTYNSKYPPANALFIAAGWVMTGHPVAGLWLSFAFMCAAVYWMLRAWAGGDWALGISLGFASWCAASYWSYTYWGGAVAAGGGALMLGAFYRIVNGRASVKNAILLGLGLLVLANSRPFEGMLVALPAAVVFARWLWRDRRTQLRQKFITVLLPLLVVGAIGIGSMGVYFSAVTGSWREMPYATYQRQRDAAPKFIWQKPTVVPTPSDKTIRWFNGKEDTTYRAARTPTGRVNYVRFIVSDFFALVIPVALALPVLLLPVAYRSRRTRFAVITIVWTVCVMGLSTWFLPHYAAPMVGLVLVAYAGCLRWLSRLRVSGAPIGRALAIASVALWFMIGLGNTALAFSSRMRGSSNSPLMWAIQRQIIADTLSRGGRRNVVVVRYGGTHTPNSEWVFNAANIDASPVVWARDMGDAGNQPLLDYFKDRAAWLVEVNGDTGPFRVRPYLQAAR